MSGGGESSSLLPTHHSATGSMEEIAADNKEMPRRQWLQDISIPVYILVMLFAIASWVDLNGLWVELPIMVDQLPEGWNLPSYLTIIIQVANIGPLSYILAIRLAPNRVKEWPIVYLVVIIGGVSCFLLIFFWDHKSFLFGKERSTSLIALSSLLALVDTTSSVVFLPYMVCFKEQYMTAFYIGEGLSGLIPAVVGLFQGVGKDPDCRNVSHTFYNSTTGENVTDYHIQPFYSNPTFSVEIFFFFLFMMICVSGIAFTCLHFAHFVKKERVVQRKLTTSALPVAKDKARQTDILETETTSSLVEEVFPELQNQEHSTKDLITGQDKGSYQKTKSQLFSVRVIVLLASSVWINSLTNGVIPSIQSYSSLPYSNRAYNLSVRFSTIANPICCFLSLFLPSKSIPITCILTLIGTAAATYQVFLAAASPHPPLLGTNIGEILVISTSVLLTGVFSYAKVSIANILRHDGRQGLVWCGLSQQIGSFAGAMIMFFLINVEHFFQSIPPCINFRS